jgi:hypothetical protein
MNLTRREFVALGLQALAYSALPSFAQENRWQFLLPPLPPKVSLEECVRLSPEIPCPATLDAVKTGHAERARRYGASGRYNLYMICSKYAVPADKDIAKPLLGYCKTADAFLRSKIPEVVGIEWIVLDKGYSGSLEGKGFVGHSYYETSSISVSDHDDKTKSFRMPYDKQISLGSFSVSYRTDHFGYSIFVSLGPGALSGALNEILTISSMSRAIDTRSQDAQALMVLSVSQVLSRQISDELKIPGAEQMLKRRLEMNSSRLPVLPKAVAVAYSLGPKRTFDLYMKDPEAFREAVRQKGFRI